MAYKIGWIESQENSGRQFSIKNYLDTKPEDIELVSFGAQLPNTASKERSTWALGPNDQDCDLYICHQSAVPPNLPRFSSVGGVKLRPVIMCAWDWNIECEGVTAVIHQSPMHASAYRRPSITQHIIPPPILPTEFADPIEAPRSRGTVWLGKATGHEGFDIAIRWAETVKSQTDFFGFHIPNPAPSGVISRFYGPVEHAQVLNLLRQYHRMVYFPREAIPFGRMIAEALMVGCELLVSGQLGIESYDQPIEVTIKDCENSPAKFWETIRGYLP